MTTADTRLVGAGRLCVEVPADWPFLGWGRVTRSHVLVHQSHSVPAVGFPPPPADVTVVELRAESPGRPRQRVVHPPWTTEVLAGHPADVLREDRHGRWWHRWSVEALGASLWLDGPEAMCRVIEASAVAVPSTHAAVPNPWLDHRGGDFGRVDRDKSYLCDLFQRSGLVPQIVGGPVGPGEQTDVTSCDPYPTSVVPVGSTVTVTVEPVDD